MKSSFGTRPDVEKVAHLVFSDKKGKIRAGCYFGDDDVFYVRFRLGAG